jgi:uncharacterized RmlC-like cupin family protein
MSFDPNAKCRVVKGGGDDKGHRQGMFVREGITQKTVGAEHLFLAYQWVPPAAKSKIHWHENCETGAYVLSGRIRIHVGTKYGEEVFEGESGDFIFIPPGAVHAVENPDANEPCVCVIARNTPNEVYQDYEEGK